MTKFDSSLKSISDINQICKIMLTKNPYLWKRLEKGFEIIKNVENEQIKEDKESFEQKYICLYNAEQNM